MVHNKSPQARLDLPSLGARIRFCRTVLLRGGRVTGAGIVRDAASTDYPTQGALGVHLARALRREEGIPAATVSRWEAGLTTPDLEMIRTIAQIAKVDPGWLAFGNESASPSPVSNVSPAEAAGLLTAAQVTWLNAEAEKQVRQIRQGATEESKRLLKRLESAKKKGEE